MEVNMPPGSVDFRIALDSVFRQSERKGMPYVDVKAADLHRQVGWYPGHNHRMRTCCNIMLQKQEPPDMILEKPRKLYGPSLKIRYRLPRKFTLDIESTNSTSHPGLSSSPQVSANSQASHPTRQREGVLVIVPCGKAKIWSRKPDRGPALACEAYTGPFFSVNKRYAEHFGEEWVILSAKHGLIRPDFVIPGPYDATFKKKSTNPVQPSFVRHQITLLGLNQFKIVVGLGGKEYLAVVKEAFAPLEVHFPFAGLKMGPQMQAIKKAIERNDPFLKTAE